VNITDVVCDMRFGTVVFAIRGSRPLGVDSEAEGFTALAEAAFAEDWDSDVDAIYDES